MYERIFFCLGSSLGTSHRLSVHQVIDKCGLRVQGLGCKEREREGEGGIECLSSIFSVSRRNRLLTRAGLGFRV